MKSFKANLIFHFVMGGREILKRKSFDIIIVDNKDDTMNWLYGGDSYGSVSEWIERANKYGPKK